MNGPPNGACREALLIVMLPPEVAAAAVFILEKYNEVCLDIFWHLVPRASYSKHTSYEAFARPVH